MKSLEGAKCVGQWQVFESTELADHVEARRLCAECPVAMACRDLLRSEQSAYHYRGSGPIGTWAGELLGSTGSFKPLPRECGSDRGYYQHRHRNEEACAMCKAAHANAERRRASA